MSSSPVFTEAATPVPDDPATEMPQQPADNKSPDRSRVDIGRPLDPVTSILLPPSEAHAPTTGESVENNSSTNVDTANTTAETADAVDKNSATETARPIEFIAPLPAAERQYYSEASRLNATKHLKPVVLIATDGSGRRVQVSSTAEAIGFLKITRNNYYAALRENIPVNGWTIDSPGYKKKGKGGGTYVYRPRQATVPATAEATPAATAANRASFAQPPRVPSAVPPAAAASPTSSSSSSLTSIELPTFLSGRKKTCGACKGCKFKKGCEVRAAQDAVDGTTAGSQPTPRIPARSSGAKLSGATFNAASDGGSTDNSGAASAFGLGAASASPALSNSTPARSPTREFSRSSSAVAGTDGDDDAPTRPVRRAVQESQLLKLQLMEFEKEEREFELQEQRVAAAAKAKAEAESAGGVSGGVDAPSSTVLPSVSPQGAGSYNFGGPKVRTVVLRSAAGGADALNEHVPFHGEEKTFDSVLAAISFLGVGKSKYYECAKLGLPCNNWYVKLVNQQWKPKDPALYSRRRARASYRGGSYRQAVADRSNESDESGSADAPRVGSANMSGTSSSLSSPAGARAGTSPPTFSYSDASARAANSTSPPTSPNTKRAKISHTSASRLASGFTFAASTTSVESIGGGSGSKPRPIQLTLDESHPDPHNYTGDGIKLRSFTSITSACQFLNIGKPTFYKRMRKGGSIKGWQITLAASSTSKLASHNNGTTRPSQASRTAEAIKANIMRAGGVGSIGSSHRTGGGGGGSKHRASSASATDHAGRSSSSAAAAASSRSRSKHGRGSSDAGAGADGPLAKEVALQLQRPSKRYRGDNDSGSNSRSGSTSPNFGNHQHHQHQRGSFGYSPQSNVEFSAAGHHHAYPAPEMTSLAASASDGFLTGCLYCGMSVKAGEISHHWDMQCKKYPIECPRCLEEHPRESFGAHSRRCSALYEPCPLAGIAGCRERLAPSQVEAHLASAHAQLLVAELFAANESIADHQSTARSLKAELAAARKELQAAKVGGGTSGGGTSGGGSGGGSVGSSAGGSVGSSAGGSDIVDGGNQ